MEFVKIERKGQIAEIVLNRSPVNAINEQLLDELLQAFTGVNNDHEVRVLIIRSELQVFIAGADIRMMQDFRNNQETMRFLQYVQNVQRVYNTLENMSKPTIAYLHGHAMGGGLELALACDFRFMTAGKARIGLPEIKLGLLPGGGGTQRLTRLIGETKAKEIIYLGRHLSAEEAFELGVVSHVIPPESGLEEVYSFARDLSENAPIALGSIKRCIQTSAQNLINMGLETELFESAILFASEDAKIGFQSFLNKTKPQFAGK